MIDKVKQLLKHSVVYSLSNVAFKASGIILLPIYTKYFSVEEYGNLGLLIITTTIFSQSIIAGQGLSLIRFNNVSSYKDKARSIFFTLTLLVTLITVLFILTAEINVNFFSQFFPDRTTYSKYLRICIYIIAVTTINNLLLSKLRADENSLFYTISGLVKLVILIALTIYLIVFSNYGIEGVLYAQLAGEVVSMFLILPHLIKQMSFKIEYTIIGESLKFGIPLIFSTIAINFLNGSDRYLIKYMLDDKQLGLYELSYRVSGIINMFLIMPLHLTFLPLAYKIYNSKDAKRNYSKFRTYISFILIWFGFFVAIFCKELIMLFALNSSYYPAYKVAPLIILAYVLYGISITSSLGMYLTGKNSYVAYITIFCATLNIFLNLLLIPVWGIMGAAINTVIAFLFLDYLYYLSSNRNYKIPYENAKVLKLFIVGFILFFCTTFIGEMNMILTIGLKLFAFAIFPFVLYFLNFYEEAELKVFKRSILFIKNPLQIIQNIKSGLLNFSDKNSEE